MNGYLVALREMGLVAQINAVNEAALTFLYPTLPDEYCAWKCFVSDTLIRLYEKRPYLRNPKY